MSIDITLRFSHPQEVLTLLEVVDNEVEDAEGCFSDEGDPLDAIVMADLKELQEALYATLSEQGFRFEGIGNGGKTWYNGEELVYRRQPKVQPVLKEDHA